MQWYGRAGVGASILQPPVSPYKVTAIQYDGPTVLAVGVVQVSVDSLTFAMVTGTEVSLFLVDPVLGEPVIAVRGFVGQAGLSRLGGVGGSGLVQWVQGRTYELWCQWVDLSCVIAGRGFELVVL